jgi:hypothetical protein
MKFHLYRAQEYDHKTRHYSSYARVSGAFRSFEDARAGILQVLNRIHGSVTTYAREPLDAHGFDPETLTRPEEFVIVPASSQDEPEGADG